MKQFYYTEMNSFNDDSPLLDDEEEILLYVDFEGTAGPNTFCNEKLELDMIGLDSDHPIMQVNGKFYEGTYEDAIGTYMLFEKDSNPVLEDDVFDKASSLKYFDKTRKLLKMKRVFVKPRLEVLGDSNNPRSIPNMDTVKEAGVPLQYQEHALFFWENVRKERLEALNDYLKKQKQREEKRQQGIEPDSESDDDNPFAMYKPSAQKLDKTSQITGDDDTSNVQNDSKNKMPLSVIHDSGPSTSYDNATWSNSEQELFRNSGRDTAYAKPKNQGYIKIIETRRSRTSKKKSQGKKSETAENSEVIRNLTSLQEHDYAATISIDTNNDLTNDTPVVENVNQVEIKTKEDESRENTGISIDEINKDVEKMNIDNLESNGDETCPENSEEFPMEEIYDKKVEKQKKREAKMNEISNRLKKVAAEIEKS